MATVTVLSGPERRRRWSSSEKARIVEEGLRPCAVVAAVARRHDVHPNLLHHWRRQAQRVLEDGQGLKFLPVAVAPSVRPKAEGSIEIELAGSVQVRVDAAQVPLAIQGGHPRTLTTVPPPLDRRLCLTTNAAQRALRGIAVGRNNGTFAGSAAGGRPEILGQIQLTRSTGDSAASAGRVRC